MGYCKICDKGRKHIPSYRKKSRKLYKTNRVKRRKIVAQSEKKHQKRVREYFWSMWGVIHPDGRPYKYEDFLDHLAKCDNRCEVCDTHQAQLKKKLVIDHNHTTGHFRGILCNRCNLLLGRVKNNPALRQKMENYLNR